MFSPAPGNRVPIDELSDDFTNKGFQVMAKSDSNMRFRIRSLTIRPSDRCLGHPPSRFSRKAERLSD